MATPPITNTESLATTAPVEAAEVANTKDQLQAMLPMLLSLRERSKMIQFVAPLESGLPRDFTELSTYYFNHNDHPELGAWKLDQDGFPPVFVRSSLADDAPKVRLATKPAGSITTEGISEERIQQSIGLLKIAHEIFLIEEREQAQVNAEVPQATRRRVGRLSLRRHRVA